MPKRYRRIAYSFVMADLLHYGHLKLLKTAKESADYHICGIVSDEACHLWQGINICNYHERKSVVEHLTCVDEVMKQESMDPTENLMSIRKKYPGSEIIVVHGNDWRTMPGKEYIESIGGRIIQPEYYAQLSRSTILDKLRHPALNTHPLQHEYYTRHFRVGNIVQFSSQAVNPLISTKANTLRNFSSLLKLSRIEEIFVCTVSDFKKCQSDITKAIQKEFKGKKIVVRSSSFSEDRYNSSNAGLYESVDNVDAGKMAEVVCAIKKVIESYRKTGPVRPKDQILVQSQTLDVAMSGVVFTRNIGNGAPYYLINYDDETGRTDTVTGGGTGKSIWIYRGSGVSEYPAQWRNLLAAVKEAESHLAGMILDIEFAQKKDGTIIIYQIRPLAANVWIDESIDDVFRRLIKENIERYRKSPERISGSNALLSDMAFWNPSEIIGDNPHPLDYSLYREIITKRAWNKGLVCLGYSPVEYELMERYGNKPYINVDYAFYSLIPDALRTNLKKKLNAFYKAKLKNDLTVHDKIEFEIAMSCYDLGIDDKICELRDNDFSEKEVGEIVASLKRLTLSVIKNYRKTLRHYKRDIKILERKTEIALKKSKVCKGPHEHVSCFLNLLEDIQLHGTPQFAAIARQAFIATALCKSLARAGLFSESEMISFMNDISTVATELYVDFQKYISGGMDKRRFLGKYGHLRAGTYDITAPRYDATGLPDICHHANVDLLRKKSGRALDSGKIKLMLKKTVFSDISEDDFVYFLKSAIEERERFKFEFTKPLSLALELIARAGELLGLSREDLSYLDIPAIASSRLYDSAFELAEFWKSIIATRKIVHANNTKLILPPVIQDESDFKIAYHWTARPNFITQNYVKGMVSNMESDKTTDVTDKIVLLKKADPGFDWIFTRKIKGLITKYGGAASHMAIRCAEFNIPAAIGCGEQIYAKISTWKELKLDCKERKIERF